jgi:predicted kinase
MAQQRPFLVIVSGPPAAGKTTVTHELAQRLGLPLLSRDAIKESVMEVIEPRTVEETDQLSQASEHVLVRVASSLLDAGEGAILESPFHVNRAPRELQPLVERSRAVTVHCQAPKQVLVERYRERAARGERDPGHMDLERARQLPEKLEEGEFEPPALGTPVLRVDTTETSEPRSEEILDWVAHQLDRQQ